MMFKWNYLAIAPLLITLLTINTNATLAQQVAFHPTEVTEAAITQAPFAVAQHQRPTVALALGGGGIRGAAHIGVLKVLQRENIPVDFIAGTSMGAIVGGMYAAGVPLDTLESMFRDRSLLNAFTPSSDTLKMLSIPGSMLWRSAKQAIGMKTNLVGLHASNDIASFVRKHVSPYRREIESTDIPFVAVVTNLLDGKAYALDHGDLGRALQASSAVPFYIKPVNIEGTLFVDGALRANVPSIAARESNADVVISVNVDEELQAIDQSTLQRVTPYGNRVLSIMLAGIDRHQAEFADVEIHPTLTPMPLYSRRVSDAERAIQAGELAAESAVSQIKAIINSRLANEQRQLHATCTQTDL